MSTYKQISLKQQLSKTSPLTIGIIVIFAAAMSYLVFRAFAASGSATLYTTPAGTQSVTNGQSFAVNARISTPSNAPTVCAEVYMSYPTDKLQVTGESYGGSPYTFEATPPSNSGGILHMLRCGPPGGTVPGGDQLYAQVTFKAIATGSAAISFTGSSVVTSGEDNTNILTQRAGVTYNISAPATPPPSTPPSSGGGTSSGSGSSSSGSTTSGGSSKSSPTQSGTGGTTSSTGGSAGSTSTPGSTTDTTGNSTASTDSNGLVSDGSVTSAVQITILDSNNKPVEGADVTVDGQTAKTDKNGVAHFDNVPAGKQTVAVKYNGKKTNKTVQVKGASTQASPELFKVSIVRDKFNPAVLTIPVVVLLVVGVFFLRPWGMKFAKAPAGQTDPDLIVTSNQPPAAASAPPTPIIPSSHDLQAPGNVYAPGQVKPDNPVPPVAAPPADENPTVLPEAKDPNVPTPNDDQPPSPPQS